MYVAIQYAKTAFGTDADRGIGPLNCLIFTCNTTHTGVSDVLCREAHHSLHSA